MFSVASPCGVCCIVGMPRQLWREYENLAETKANNFLVLIKFIFVMNEMKFYLNKVVLKKMSTCCCIL